MFAAFLKQIPVRRIAFCTVIVVVFAVIARYAIVPVGSQVFEKAIGLWSYYSGADKALGIKLKAEQQILSELEQKVSSVNGAEKNSSVYYDFLQVILKKHGLSAGKINAGNQITKNSIVQQDLSVTVNCTYHVLGTILDDLENGQYFCCIKNVHLVSRSLLGNSLDADVNISFYRLKK
jgi:hypothetical protein